MKRKSFFTILLLGMLFFTFVNCSKADRDLTIDQVPEAVQKAFEAKFPGKSAKWEKEHGLIKAEFYNEARQEVEVYFDKRGNWVKTKTDLKKMDLPQNVVDLVSANWPDYYVDDVELIETPASTYYLIELENMRGREIKVKITPDAKIIK